MMDDQEAAKAVDAWLADPVPQPLAPGALASTNLAAARASGQTPDFAAESRRIAAEIGVPEYTGRAAPEAVRQRSFEMGLTGLQAVAPKTAAFLDDPGLAAIALDDVPTLTGIEDLFGLGRGQFVQPKYFGASPGAPAPGKPLLRFERKAPGATLSAPLPVPDTWQQWVAGIWQDSVSAAVEVDAGLRMQYQDLRDALGLGTLDRQTGEVQSQDLLLYRRRGAGYARELSTPEIEDDTKRGIYGGLTSLARTAPGVAASLATANPLPAFLSMGATTQADAYGKYRERGGTPGEAFLGATGEAAVEVGTELLPTGKMLGAFGKTGEGAIKDFLLGLGLDIPGEQIATFVQDAIDTAIANPDKTWADFAAERPDAAYQTLVATLTQGGIMSALNTTAVMLNRQEVRAEEGEKTAGVLEELDKLAAVSPLRERDPAAFEAFVADVVADGVDSVYVDAKTFAQAAANATPEEQAILEGMASMAGLAEAAETGQDIKIPVAEFAARLAGTSLAPAIIENGRANPFELSRAQAKVAREVQGEELQAEAEKVLASSKVDEAFRASAKVVEDQIVTQLTAVNRFSNDVNKAYAKAHAAFYVVQAARWGVTPEEMAQRYPLRITAQEAPGSNPLRQNLPTLKAPPTSPSGKVQLLHWGKRGKVARLDPKKWGGNQDVLSRAERMMADDDRHPGRVYFGIGVGQPGGYTPEFGLGEHLYGAEIDIKDLYDYDADPLGLRAGRVKEMLADEGFDAEPEEGMPDFGYYDEAALLYDLAIREAGYKGFWTAEQGSGLIGVSFEKVKAEYQGKNDGQAFYQRAVAKGDGRRFRDFFAGVTSGASGRPDKTNDQRLVDLSEVADFSAEYNKHLGNFDKHIEASIPSFREVQHAVGAALVKALPDGSSMLDIAGSEGALAKAISAVSKGGIETVVLDPNQSMRETFANTSQVPGATFVMDAFTDTAADEGQTLWTEPALKGDGEIEIKGYTPSKPFTVVHEAMGFQFIHNDREAQVSRVKELLEEGGLAVFEEKFVPGNGLPPEQWKANEAKKDDFKRQFFSEADIAAKAKTVLQGETTDEEKVVGMNDLMVAPGDFENTLRGHFAFVVQFWDSGNFKGYMASDSAEMLSSVLENLIPLDSEFSTAPTPREVGAPVDRISTRQPSTKRAQEDALAEVLDVGIEPMARNEKVLAHNADLISTYPGFSSTATTPLGVVKDFAAFVESNLLWLFDRVPVATRERARLWYDGGNKLANRWGERYGVPPRAVAAVIASLSPQKDWYQNVSLAERILDITTHAADYVFDEQMAATAERIFGKPQYADAVAGLKGKSLSEITNPVERAMWVRTYDEAHNPRGFRVTTPEGEFVGEAKGNVAWGSNVEIAKALEVLRDTSRENISRQMGTKHKVRSFYNNIIAPNAGNDVTIDTHAVAAGLARPLSGGSAEVHHNFGSSPEKAKQPAGWRAAKNAADFGIEGTYGIYADAYRSAAAARGVLPREMQSVTWEAVRGLFEAKAKRAKGAQSLTGKVDAAWRAHEEGKATLDGTRNEIESLAGGIQPPSWEGLGAGVSGEAQAASYDGELVGRGVPRRATGGLGDGSGNPAGAAGVGTFAQSNPIFYSALARAVEASPTKRAPAAQWKATLAKTPGVKREEIEWTGVEEWLDMQEGVVERDDLQTFLADNGVQLEEVTLGGGGYAVNTQSRYYVREFLSLVETAPDRETAAANLYNDPAARAAARKLNTPRWNGGLYDDGALAEDWADTVADDLLLSPEDGPNAAKFRRYKLPGADDTYKELLITLPKIGGPTTHWDVDNVVAHARVTERKSADGKRVLFLEEVQSDWHQKGRDQGYDGDSSAEEKAAAELVLQQASVENGEASDAYITAVREAIYAKAAAYEALVERSPPGMADVQKGLAVEMRERVGAGLSVSSARQYLVKYNIDPSPEIQAAEARYTTARLRLHDAAAATVATVGGIPDAPFRKSWSTLVMKRMIRYAVDNGFEQVAWINGNQQNGGTTGGDGSFFYERNLVNTTNDLIKKYGAKVEQIDMRAEPNADRESGAQVRRELLDEARATGSAEAEARAQERLDSYLAASEKPSNAPGIQNGFTITPELAAASQAGMPLFQNGEDRGSFDPNTNTINLLRRADLSTFLHETGHFYLNVLADMASRPDAPAEVVADMETTLRWFGVPNLQTWLSMSLDEQRPHHEKWARGYEAFLFEGKAPNLGMRELFAKFSAWMKLVYKSLTELNVELDDEVRGVFNRLLATSEEIAAAEDARSFLPIFQSKPEGMTDDEWVDYQRLGQQATADAASELQTRSLRDMKWLSNAKSRALRELQKGALAKRKNVRDEVTAEVQAEPVYRALAYLKRGEIDGVPVEGARKLSIQGLKDQFAGVAPELQDWTQLGYGKYGMLAENGMTPDEAADLLGFDTGAELVDALLNAEPMGEKIAGLTDQRMLERYGDLTDPASMARAAEEAVHNEARIRFVATELNALAKAVGKPSILNAAVKEYAAGIIARLPIKELRPHRYTAAALRAAKASEKALAKGNRLEAVTEKRNQLINLQAARGAWDARTEVEKGMALFARIAKAKDDNLSKSRNMDLVNAARAIMATYGVGRSKNDPAGYMQALKRYDPALYADLEPFIEAATARPKPIAELTYEEFIGLRDTVNQLWVLARRSKVIEIDGKQIEIDTAAGEMGARLDEIGVPPRDLDHAPTDGERKLRQLSGLRAAMRRVEHWAQLLGKPFTKYIWQPVSEAADAYRLEKPVYFQKFLSLLEPIQATLKPVKLAAPEIGYTFSGKSELLHAILHTGNLSNKTKLLVGRGWGTLTPDGVLNDARWQALVDRLHAEGVLTKADYDFAQGVWDLLEETKPLAQRAHHAMYGRYFAEVTADEVVTPFGNYRGGYVPALTDAFLVQDAALRADSEAVEGGDHSMFPSPTKGFTKSRVENYNRELALDLRLLPQHIDKVLKFAHLGPPVRDVLRLLKAKGFSAKLEKFDPVAQTELLLPWLNRAVRQRVSTPMTGEAGRMADSFFRTLRQRTGLGIMFGNLINSLQQLTGFTVAMVKVKPYYLRAGVFNYLRGPTQLAESIAQVSPFMSERLASQTFEINQAIDDIVLDPNGFDKTRDFFNRHGYFLQHAFQNTVDLVTWQGAYEQATAEGMLGKDAVRAAAAAVRQSQGAMNPEDLSRIEAGNTVFRLFTQFSTYFNNLANLLGTEFSGTLRDAGFKGTPRLVYVYFMGFAAPALLADLIVRAMRGEGDDEDDGWMDEFLDWFFGAQFRTALAMIPVAGGSVASVFNTFNDKPYDDRIANSPVISTLESAARAPKSVYSASTGDGSTKRAVKDSLSAVALATGLPVTVLGKPVGYAIDVAEGKTKPTGPVDAVRGAVSGKGPPPSF